MRKKPTRKQSYFTIKPAMTAILCDASGKNASWDTIWSSSELHPCFFSCFVCYIWVCKNLSELCCKIFCCSDTFFAPGWTAYEHLQHYFQNQPLAPLLISKSWQGKLLNPRAIRKTLLHFFANFVWILKPSWPCFEIYLTCTRDLPTIPLIVLWRWAALPN